MTTIDTLFNIPITLSKFALCDVIIVETHAITFCTFFGGGGVCVEDGGVLRKMNGLKTFSNTVPRLNQIAEFVNCVDP